MLAPTQPHTRRWHRAPLLCSLQKPGQPASPNCKETSYPGRKCNFPLPQMTALLLRTPLCTHADAQHLVGTQQHSGLVPASPGWKGRHKAGSTPLPLLKWHSRTPDAYTVHASPFTPHSLSTSMSCPSDRSSIAQLLCRARRPPLMAPTSFSPALMCPPQNMLSFPLSTDSHPPRPKHRVCLAC